ncbi:hypothetical protein N656DRAFT_89995 [Canariomyces notabilis]|uniref:Uncharacterized protein n=1 Tax=Canariomyces notabilis TaxID=2074819 RepID=A0AAN6TE59_9PEZI|nr:hypothetical protein N656DRAFT_89995 [Canariomyces arenarius]
MGTTSSPVRRCSARFGMRERVEGKERWVDAGRGSRAFYQMEWLPCIVQYRRRQAGTKTHTNDTTHSLHHAVGEVECTRTFIGRSGCAGSRGPDCCPWTASIGYRYLGPAHSTAVSSKTSAENRRDAHGRCNIEHSMCAISLPQWYTSDATGAWNHPQTVKRCLTLGIGDLLGVRSVHRRKQKKVKAFPRGLVLLFLGQSHHRCPRHLAERFQASLPKRNFDPC